MNIQPIYKGYFHYPLIYKKEQGTTCPSNQPANNYTTPTIYNPAFGLANSSKLKTLFSYGLPCMYSGIEMIDPKKVQRLMKINAFDGPIKEVLKSIKPFENSIKGIELYIYKILQEQSELHPDKTVQEIFKNIEPIYKKRLRKKQTPTFQELKILGQKLPDNYRYKFRQFMEETDNKLNDQPIIVPFSKFEFNYKLEKIKEDIDKKGDIKSSKVINRLVKESKKLSADTNNRTYDHQLDVINLMQIMLKTSVLKNDERLITLLETSKSKINMKEVLVPFSRKSFLYDLDKLLIGLPDKKLQEKMISVAENLPTSKESRSAYILKFVSQPSEKIIYRLLWPTFASVEHIHPRSCGGPDKLSNYGGATTEENSDRKNLEFTKQMKRKPDTKINCQKYIDRLIELANEGVFSKINLNINYIFDFKKAIQKESKGAIILDDSNLIVKK